MDATATTPQEVRDLTQWGWDALRERRQRRRVNGGSAITISSSRPAAPHLAPSSQATGGGDPSLVSQHRGQRSPPPSESTPLPRVLSQLITPDVLTRMSAQDAASEIARVRAQLKQLEDLERLNEEARARRRDALLLLVEEEEGGGAPTHQPGAAAAAAASESGKDLRMARANANRQRATQDKGESCLRSLYACQAIMEGTVVLHELLMECYDRLRTGVIPSVKNRLLHMCGQPLEQDWRQHLSDWAATKDECGEGPPQMLGTRDTSLGETTHRVAHVAELARKLERLAVQLHDMHRIASPHVQMAQLRQRDDAFSLQRALRASEDAVAAAEERYHALQQTRTQLLLKEEEVLRNGERHARLVRQLRQCEPLVHAYTAAARKRDEQAAVRDRLARDAARIHTSIACVEEEVALLQSQVTAEREARMQLTMKRRALQRERESLSSEAQALVQKTKALEKRKAMLESQLGADAGA